MVYITEESTLIENIPFKTQVNNFPVVLWKTKTGIYCLLDNCSHEEYPLSESEADEEDSITCNRHGAKFDLTNGYPMSLPAFSPVQTFKVILQDGKVYLDE